MAKKAATFVLLVAVLSVASLTDTVQAGVGKTISLIEQKFGGTINVAGVSDGEQLTWDAASSSWIASPAGGSSPTLTAVLTAGNTVADGQQILGDPDADPFYAFDADTGIASSAADKLQIYANGEIFAGIDQSDTQGAKVFYFGAATEADGASIRVRSDLALMNGFRGGNLNDWQLNTLGFSLYTERAIMWHVGEPAFGTAITNQLHKNGFGFIQLSGATKNSTWTDLNVGQLFNSNTGDGAGTLRRWIRTGSNESLHNASWEFGWASATTTISGSSTFDTGIRRWGEGDVVIGDSKSGVAGGTYGTAISHTSSLETGVTGATVDIAALVPNNRYILGVTVSVQTALGVTNGTTGFDVGTTTDPDAYAANVGVTSGSRSDWDDATAADGRPRFTTAGAETVRLTALTGNFDGTGDIRVTVHYLEIVPPQSDEGGNPH